MAVASVRPPVELSSSSTRRSVHQHSGATRNGRGRPDVALGDASLVAVVLALAHEDQDESDLVLVDDRPDDAVNVLAPAAANAHPHDWVPAVAVVADEALAAFVPGPVDERLHGFVLTLVNADADGADGSAAAQ